MECEVSDIFNFYRLPTGRRLHAMTEVERRASERGITRVAAHARRCVQHDQVTLAMEQQRRGESRAIYTEEARALDPVLDRTVLGFESYLQTQIRVFSAESQRGQAATLVTRELFPTGALPITSLSFIEQHAEIDTLLRRCDEPELAAALARLPDAVPMLDRIRELNTEYGASIRAPERVPSASEAREARAFGHELMCETAVLIVAHFLTHAPDDKEGRAYLLEPIVRQNELVRQARRRRRIPDDIDLEPADQTDDPDAPPLAAMLPDDAADSAITGEFPIG